jgi:septum formation inhibitor-activating ATPase MinD
VTTKAKAAAQQEAQEIGEVATAILAYLDMGEEATVEHILRTLDHRTLGMVISTWYFMCVSHHGEEIVANTARRTAQFFQAAIEDKTTESHDAVAASFSKGLLLNLAAGLNDLYAELWQSIVNHQPDITVDVAARMLGFARGLIGDMPGPDCD